MLNFKIMSIFSGSKYSYQKYHQICSTVKFAKSNSRILPFLDGICMGGTLRMSNFKILSTFSGSQYSYQTCRQMCSTGKFAE
jgi:hypothetical protein